MKEEIENRHFEMNEHDAEREIISYVQMNRFYLFSPPDESASAKSITGSKIMFSFEMSKCSTFITPNGFSSSICS